MPAPTALQRRPEEFAHDVTMEPSSVPLPEETEGELVDMSLDPVAAAQEPEAPADDISMTDESGAPKFPVAKSIPLAFRREQRKVPIPPHRMTPLKANWPKIYPPRRTTNEQRYDRHRERADFLKAFTLGFDVDDAIFSGSLPADLYIETFEIKDVKTLQGEHLGRAIGRIAGKDGKTKFAIENASRTRVVLADQKIHILGGFKNIHIARESIVSLILGQNPSKVYGNLRTVAGRMKERF
ncbi:pre-rRNA-processing protein pno1 [Pyrenophora teres f. teres]|nr:pre-rRNA-processing protein pno1 [Pyrenophora teres f. teres]